MARLICDISISLDGFVAGPNPSLEQPLGEGGDRLHEWAFAAASWRESHGLEGGETNADSEVIEESLRATGAVVMGRKMFSGGEGPWENDPRADGWWGDEPPFHVPVFVLTHHARETKAMEGGTSFTFVTDGIEAALEQARAAAGDKDVHLAGGASVVQQYLKAGLLDELQIHVAPVLLGDGTSLFDRLGIDAVRLETTRVIASPSVTHLKFRVPARST
ncbi:MAG: dihydrofolate reductase family protein [Actinomycetota bacterium]|nr:dihydrofolate reductase family protein [Actinomycetota bacterium]